VKMALTVQARATGVLTLINLSDQPLNIEVPLAMGANPQAPPPGVGQAYYATAFGTPGAPQSLAVAVNPQWSSTGVQKKARKSNVKSKKKKPADEEAAKDEKKSDEKKSDEKDAKKDDAAKNESLVATVPLPPGATQTLPLFTLGLNMKKPQATYGQFAPADLDNVTQAPQIRKVLELLVQGKFTADVAQTLAWHYNEPTRWDEMAGFVTPIQLQLAQRAAEMVEGTASPDAAPTTGKKKR
ncbi:MAG: hypothetical protein ACREHD_32565, partial [Pirellulales bacterium]